MGGRRATPGGAAAGEWVYGRHAVASLWPERADDLLGLWVQESAREDWLGRLAEQMAQAGVAVHRVSRRELDALVPGRHQGVAAQVRLREAGSEADLVRRVRDWSAPEPPLLLVLDGVQDPHNLGACLRTAEAAGVDAVVAPRDRAVGLTATVRKVACGAAERVPFHQVTNLARTLRALKQLGVWVAGTDGAATESLYEGDLRGPLALVLGAEGRGLRRLTRDECDYLLAIPMAGAAESLNVSVAAGVCLFEARRQRTATVPRVAPVPGAK